MCSLVVIKVAFLPFVIVYKVLRLVFGKVWVNLPLVTKLKQVSSSILSQIIEHLILVMEKMLSLVVIKVPVLVFLIVLESFKVDFWKSTGQNTPSYQVEGSFQPYFKLGY